MGVIWLFNYMAMFKYKNFSVILSCLFFVCCNSLDDDNNRLDKLGTVVSDLQSAMDVLQKACDEGQQIKTIAPLENTESGWTIQFADESIIRMVNRQNGKFGVNIRDSKTPYLYVNQDGYWCISYDDGEHFTRLMDNNGNYIIALGEKDSTGARGDNGVSIRVKTDEDGFYNYELYKADDPTTVIETIVTPYNTNPAYLITSIVENDVTNFLTLTMQNGKTYTFNKVYNAPSSVTILSDRLLLGGGSTATFEFGINPSNATFNYDVTSPDCEIELDFVGATRSINSDVNQPEYYKLTKVEQVYDDTGIMKVGQYRAYITDLNLNDSYNDLIALVLTVTDANGEKMYISSSAIQIKFSGNLLTEFKFLKFDNGSTKVLENVEATIDGNNITINTPFILDKANLVACFKSNGKNVYVGDKEQSSSITVNDFSGPVKYTVVSADGEKNDYLVTLNISGLPVVYINTPDDVAITSREEWTKNSSIKIVKTDGSEDYSNNKLQIRGRGNSTWWYPKKPYALKLKDNSEILGMPAHKRWVLLANWLDRTLLRNDVSFQISKQTCMAWTPRGKFVEVVLNGKHIGNYYLCEQIKVDENRVNIAKMETTDVSGESLTGGYLMELDLYYDEVNKFKSANNDLPYMFKEPDEDVLQAEQFAYFQNYINDLESKLYSDTWLSTRDYVSMMDLNTFADWWFVHELSKNWEPNHPKSCYMHKDRNGVLKAGPVWDFDCGTYTPDIGYTVNNALYYGRLFSDPAFVTIVKTRWAALKPQFDAIGAYIRSIAAQTRVSNEINIGLWPISSTDNGDETMSFDVAIDRMVDAYEAKLAWLDLQIIAM